MTDRDLAQVPDERLAELFSEISIQQADALGLGDVSEFNRLYGRLSAVKAVLRERGQRSRQVLLPLLKHSRQSRTMFADQVAQIRLNAAKELLTVAPEQARATLQDLASHGPSAQRGDAGMCLQLLRDGVFKPT